MKQLKRGSWSQTEINFLIQTHNKMARSDIAKILGRNSKSVSSKIRSLTLNSGDPMFKDEKPVMSKNPWLNLAGIKL